MLWKTFKIYEGNFPQEQINVSNKGLDSCTGSCPFPGWKRFCNRMNSSGHCQSPVNKWLYLDRKIQIPCDITYMYNPNYDTGEGGGTTLQYSCLENPWTEEPGRLQSTGSLRVGHNWTTSLSLFTFMHWRRKWQPTPVFLPGDSQGWGSLLGCRLWGRTELDTTEAT